MNPTTQQLRALGYDVAGGKAVPAAPEKPRANRGEGPVSQRKCRRLNDGMNGWEKRYADIIRRWVAAGIVTWWGFERITLKLADDCRYTPDFAVRHATGDFEFIEIKGHKRDDAVVKFKAAAEANPWASFRMVSYDPTRGWGDLYYYAALAAGKAPAAELGES